MNNEYNKINNPKIHFKAVYKLVYLTSMSIKSFSFYFELYCFQNKN